jgi:hypothetical protein
VEVPERLLMTLMYFRLYTTESLLGYLFDLHESSVNRERNQRMVPVLLEVLPVPMRDKMGLLRSAPGEPVNPMARKRIGTLEELLEKYPEIREVLIDATEQPTQRPKDKPKDKQARQEHYSGKKKRHTLKTQVSTTDKPVLHASAHVPPHASESTFFPTLLRGKRCIKPAIPGTRGQWVPIGHAGVGRAVVVPISAFGQAPEGTLRG